MMVFTKRYNYHISDPDNDTYFSTELSLDKIAALSDVADRIYKNRVNEDKNTIFFILLEEYDTTWSLLEMGELSF